ncbi:MAG: hypothetical protein IIU08_11075 [Clostridia bacterium]|nr:hypothetical protein [Clostridia bacterium]
MTVKRISAALLALLLVTVMTVAVSADIAPLPDEEYERIFGISETVALEDPDPEPETEPETEPEKEETSAPAPEKAEIKPFPSPSQIVTAAVSVAVIAAVILACAIIHKKKGAQSK